MALPMIETGYKPEFGLGAVYQGFNAGNADMSAQEELIKQFLANQRERQMQPMDVDIKQYDADLANAKRNDPNFIPWQLAGQSGQMMSQDAAGRLKQALLPQEMTVGKQGLAHQESTGNLLARLDALKAGGQGGSGTMGFQMQPQAPQTPSGGVSGFFTGSQSDIQKAGQLIQSMLEGVDKQMALQAFQQSQPQAINANNSPIVPQSPRRNGGIQPGGAEYEQIMQSLVDTPELRAKLLQGDQKFDSAEYQAMLRGMFAKDAATARAGAGGKPEKLSMEQRVVRDIDDRLQRGIITFEEAVQERNDWLNRKMDKPLQQGITPQMRDGQVVLENKETQTSQVESKSGAKPQVTDTDLINKYLKK